MDALNVRNSQRIGQEEKETASLRLEKALQEAENRLEAEKTYMMTLRHMKAARRDWVTRLIEPLQKQKSEFTHILTLLAQESLSLYHVELEANQAVLQAEEAARTAVQQRERHSQALDLKAQQYRDRREFQELVARQSEQKSISKAIKANESHLAALTDHLNTSIEEENAQKTYQAIETQSKSQEVLFQKLSKAASAYNISDIVDYWTYLQSTRESLETSIKEQTQKVASLKKELVVAKAEFAEFQWQYTPAERLPQPVIESYMSRLSTTKENLDRKESQVETMQITTWELYVAEVKEGLQRILQTFTPGLEELPLRDTCEEIVLSAQKCLSRVDGR